MQLVPILNHQRRIWCWSKTNHSGDSGLSTLLLAECELQTTRLNQCFNQTQFIAKQSSFSTAMQPDITFPIAFKKKLSSCQITLASVWRLASVKVAIQTTCNLASTQFSKTKQHFPNVVFRFVFVAGESDGNPLRAPTRNFGCQHDTSSKLIINHDIQHSIYSFVRTVIIQRVG